MTRRNYTGYIFIAPMLILFLVFIVYPIVFNSYISFFDWNGININKSFAGLQNYKKIFKDPVLLKIFRNFFFFASVTITVQAMLGMIFASFFMRGLKFSGFYRTLVYLPVIATPAIIGNIFSRILETNRGDLNVFLRQIGLGFFAQPWLATPKWALWMVIMVNIWQWTGYSMLIYYTNMLNIPEDIFEAATIDGANQVQQFFRITFPMLRGTHFTLFIMGALGSLKCFDLPYILTKGGPNYATEFFSTYIYRKSFDLFDQGGASALVMIMFVIALLITAIQLKIYNRKGVEKEMYGV
jgi:raffinose/stachyose/melibiose transport system permease protein